MRAESSRVLTQRWRNNVLRRRGKVERERGQKGWMLMSCFRLITSDCGRHIAVEKYLLVLRGLKKEMDVGGR